LIWTGYDERGFTTVYTSYPGTTQAPVTQLPASTTAAQPTTTTRVSVDLMLENAAETAPPVPKANPAEGLRAYLSSKPYMFLSFAAMLVGIYFN
jgi:hypothetical protein